jgi:hypothetical protein
MNASKADSRPSLVAGFFLAAAVLGGAPAIAQASNRPPNSADRNVVMTMQIDLAMRSADIHWPDGFDPEAADLFSHNQLVINATCERIWQHIVDVTRWPEWLWCK